MDKISKFLKTLSQAQRAYLLSELLPRIQSLNLKGLDVKPIKGHKDIFRVRWGNIRVLFVKNKAKGILCGIGRRKDIYKNL